MNMVQFIFRSLGYLLLRAVGFLGTPKEQSPKLPSSFRSQPYVIAPVSDGFIEELERAGASKKLLDSLKEDPSKKIYN